MALTVGELAVELEARTREFRSELRQAEKRVSRFEKTTTKDVRRAGTSFRGLLGPIAAVGAALAALGGVRVLTNLGKASIATASAFESYEIRLKALLGSQAEANTALENFLTLSSETPFAVRQIVGGAATLASVALGNRRALEELTGVAANLAAVTGLSFEEAAGNLQRALAAGIGAADLFRDRGVRRLIESIQGIPDLTQVSLEELRQAFVDTFGDLGRFGTAAQQLSTTLGGALSNVGDAAERFRLAFGKALAPAVVATARGVLIPFFGDLQTKVEDNEEALQKFFIDAFAKAVGAIRELLRALAPLGAGFVATARDARKLGGEVSSVFKLLRIFVSALSTGLDALDTGLNAIGASLRVVGFLVGGRTREEVEEQMDALDASVTQLVKSSTALNKLMTDTGDATVDSLETSTGLLNDLADSLEGAEGRIRAIGEETIRTARKRGAARPEDGVPGGGAVPVVDREALKEALEERQARADVAAAEERFDRLVAGLSELPSKELATLADAFGGSVREGLATALQSVVRGEGVDFATVLADLSGNLLEESLSDALDAVAELARKLFEDLGQEIGGLFGDGAGSGLGSALGAALGIGAALISNALEGTETNVSGAMVDSAVTSTQAVRGLVAGNVAVPIAQVGNAIRDANVESLRESRRGNSILEQILAAVRAGGGDQADASDTLAALVSAEFNGSVALG